MNEDKECNQYYLLSFYSLCVCVCVLPCYLPCMLYQCMTFSELITIPLSLSLSCMCAYSHTHTHTHFCLFPSRTMWINSTLVSAFCQHSSYIFWLLILTLPHPGGPHRIMLGISCFSSNCLKILFGPKTWSCPT